jgi:hypothetical protein
MSSISSRFGDDVLIASSPFIDPGRAGEKLRHSSRDVMLAAMPHKLEFSSANSISSLRDSRLKDFSSVRVKLAELVI